jgi:sec-independent protein translocase protein TatB
MFDIGFSEVLIIAVVALLVLGPERLPKAARFAGLWVRRARAQWYSVKAEFEREIAQEDLMRQVREPFAEALAETGAQMRALDAELSAAYVAAGTPDAPNGPGAGTPVDSDADTALVADADVDADAGPAAVHDAGVDAGAGLVAHADADDDAPVQGDLLAPLPPPGGTPPRNPDPLGVALP